MEDWVSRHLFHLFTKDGAFLKQWAQLAPAQRERMVHLLRHLDHQRTTLTRARAQLITLHHEATEWSRFFFREISERDPGIGSSAMQMIALARDRARQHRAHDAAADWLQAFVEDGPVPVVRWYGGLKDSAAVQATLAAHRQGASLDLDDLIRFRVVLSTLDDLRRFAASFLPECTVLRCRDYYRRQRHHPDNPYRAVHVVTAGVENTVVEIQLQTELRDVVGTIDHSLVCKRQVPFQSKPHQRWLQDISKLANIVDADQAGAADDSVPAEWTAFSGSGSLVVGA